MAIQEEQRETRREELFFPRGLNPVSRLVLWLRGYFDGRANKVRNSDNGYITSPLCKSLAESADMRINAEWQYCNGLMFEIEPKLEKAISDYDELTIQLDTLCRLREFELSYAMLERDGDSVVSEHLAIRRKNKRIQRAESCYATKELDLRQRLNGVGCELSALLAEFQDCKDATVTHERVVRLDYVARLSTYARGVSRKRLVNPSYINDKALTTKPRSDNDTFFDALAARARQRIYMQLTSRATSKARVSKDA